MGERWHWWSNSTQHEIWAANWCNRCANDHVTHRREPDYEHGCELIALMYGLDDHREIPELFAFNEEDEIHGNPTCLRYKPCKCVGGGGGGGGDLPRSPRPKPGQGRLFDMEPHAKVYRDVLIDADLIEVRERV
jgi:hypothetical protein